MTCLAADNLLCELDESLLVTPPPPLAPPAPALERAAVALEDDSAVADGFSSE